MLNPDTTPIFQRLLIVAAITLWSVAIVMGQGSGRLKGTVRVASGAPVAGVQVVVTNQVTGKWKRMRSNNDGQYSFQLPAGAYRLRVNAPHRARFEIGKDYGEFS